MENTAMADAIKRYYKMGLYTVDDLKLFLSVGYITQADYDELTTAAA